jgi:hypothetical protein
MEDEQRPLPQGWVRQYDDNSNHQFFVDTSKEPPRSIWHHPYDDEQYLGSLSPEERDKVTRLHHSVSLKDIAAESSDDEAGPSSRKPVRGGAPSVASGVSSAGASSSSKEPAPTGLHKYGRKLKDRITSSTHEERERQRDQRAQEEAQAYQAHLALRQAMTRAVQTGQPQFIAKDREGHDVYIEPPNGPAIPRGARGYNPYANGVYTNPNARFIRPDYPYDRYVGHAGHIRSSGLTCHDRPYGYGYGGGYGFPLVGGLLGGAVLGGLLF